MEYKIITSETFFRVQEQVNEHIKFEWLPLGGLCFVDGMTAQAMTRTVKQKKAIRRKKRKGK